MTRTPAGRDSDSEVGAGGPGESLAALLWRSLAVAGLHHGHRDAAGAGSVVRVPIT